MTLTKNQKLAEFIGIMLGDGSLCLKNGSVNTNNRIKITFNRTDDADYIVYVADLMGELFNVKPIIKHRNYERNTTDLFLFKKPVILRLINDIGLKLSPKWGRAVIPNIFCSYKLGVHVIRGYFDTDGCLVTTNNNGSVYPRLEMKVCPSPMQEQFIELLKKYKFKFGVYQIGKGEVRIQLNGKKELKKWIKKIGFSNTKHRLKISRFI